MQCTISMEVYTKEASKPSLYIVTGGQWHTVVITQVASLNSYDLFLFILVTHLKQLYYCKTVEESFNFVAQDIF